jgi:hypothetical protein
MCAKKAESSIPADKLALYEALVATAPDVLRKGASVPYTSMNGNMFSYLAKDGTLALRLPPEARAAFIAEHKAHLMEAYGIIQKEYVAVPAALLANTRALRPYFELSVAYAKSLKPKATTKAASAKKKTNGK